MSEIWTIMTLVFSANEGVSALEQFVHKNEAIPTVYFSDYDKCDWGLRKLFGEFDYNGHKSQLFYLPDNRLILHVSQKNKVNGYLCVKLANFN